MLHNQCTGIPLMYHHGGHWCCVLPLDLSACHIGCVKVDFYLHPLTFIRPLFHSLVDVAPPRLPPVSLGSLPTGTIFLFDFFSAMAVPEALVLAASDKQSVRVMGVRVGVSAVRTVIKLFPGQCSMGLADRPVVLPCVLCTYVCTYANSSPVHIHLYTCINFYAHMATGICKYVTTMHTHTVGSTFSRFSTALHCFCALLYSTTLHSVYCDCALLCYFCMLLLYYCCALLY